MKAKTISHCQGKGSLSHNNRTFKAKNVDKSRSGQNVTFVKIPITEAYDKCFSEAVGRYNAKQKRADRRIKDGYFRYAFSHAPSNNVITAADKRKSFYEDVVQIGDRSDTGMGTADAETAAKCLTEYMQGFSERNPNFFVFNAVLHVDEATPHLHIDYIPIGHYKRGVDTQNGLAQALKEMGYGEGEKAISRWRVAEYNTLTEICRKHGIEISEPKKGRGYSYTVDEYKQHKDTINVLEQRENELTDNLNKLVRLNNTAKSRYKEAKIEVERAEKEAQKIREESELRARVARLNSNMLRQMTNLNAEMNSKERSKLEKETEKLKSEFQAFQDMVERFKEFVKSEIPKIKDSQTRATRIEEIEKELFSLNKKNESIADYLNRITHKTKQKERSL